MNISGVNIHARHGVKMTVHLQDGATAIAIRDRDEYQISVATIFLPIAACERASRAVAAFNLAMSEPDAKKPEDQP